jgi:hypothetical protein
MGINKYAPDLTAAAEIVNTSSISTNKFKLFLLLYILFLCRFTSSTTSSSPSLPAKQE